MSLFKRFLKIFISSSYAGVFFVRICHYTFIFRNPIAIITECAPTVFITALLIAAVAYSERNNLIPFDKIINKAKKEKRPLTEKEKKTCLACYKNFDKGIAVGEGIGFLLGSSSTTIVEALTGVIKFDLIQFIIIVLHSIGIGFICYTIVTHMIKKDTMTSYLKDVGIKMDNEISKNTSITFAICLYVAVMNFITVPTGLIKNPVDNGLQIFILNCFIAFLLTAGVCYLSYSVLIKRMQSVEKKVKDMLSVETENLAKTAEKSVATSQEQNAAVKEIVATMEDSNTLSSNINSKIQAVASLAEKSKLDVITGATSLKQNIGKLTDIIEINKSTIDGIRQLSERIRHVYDVVSFINEMADQSKIIAFNAELEANSAGEAGKNFHIVASEVRRLSDNIIDGTKEIKEKIDEMIDASDELISRSENGSDKIETSCNSVMSLENMFENVQTSSEMTASRSEEIIGFINQLTAASDQIFITLKHLASGVESFSEASNHISVSSQNVKQIASEL